MAAADGVLYVLGGIGLREAVSYTHLDVYKRQGGGGGTVRMRVRRLPGGSLCPGTGGRPRHGPVSYTHLNNHHMRVINITNANNTSSFFL